MGTGYKPPRGHAWRDQSLPKLRRSAGNARPKRAFTRSEMVKLLKGTDEPELADAMRVAALSGMRLEEIYRLTVKDCADGWFDIRVSKTEAGERKVPTHPDLAPIVSRRSLNKTPSAFLFHEAGGPAKPGRERSMPISKRFGRYRQSVGVHERPDGQRQSAVDFHSFRRWFITEAERADQPPHVISAVVGHEAGRETITLKTYSDGPEVRQLRACVCAVKLPELSARAE